MAESRFFEVSRNCSLYVESFVRSISEMICQTLNFLWHMLLTQFIRFRLQRVEINVTLIILMSTIYANSILVKLIILIKTRLEI